MPFIFEKWATAHALNLMGPMGLCFPYFNSKLGFDFPLMAQHLIFLATTWTFSTPAATFLPPSTRTTPLLDEVAYIRGRTSLTGALRLPASPTSKASLVTSSHCEQRLNGAPKGHFLSVWKEAWNGTGIAPEMALVVAQKMALPMALQAVPERGWYGAWNGIGYSPKNGTSNGFASGAWTGLVWRLKWHWFQPQKCTSNGATSGA